VFNGSFLDISLLSIDISYQIEKSTMNNILLQHDDDDCDGDEDDDDDE
jgi:hypothetical protein